jgi:hypothetical protein
MTDQQMVRTIVKSVRLSPFELNLIETECQTRNLGFSEFIRTATLAKVHTQPQTKRPLEWLVCSRQSLHSGRHTGGLFVGEHHNRANRCLSFIRYRSTHLTRTAERPGQ